MRQNILGLEKRLVRGLVKFVPALAGLFSPDLLGSCLTIFPGPLVFHILGPSMKHLTGNGGKLNTSQVEPIAANSRAVGQFLSISC